MRAMKTVVVFQGGGALGAFGAGAWSELALETGLLDGVVAVAGGSIGAINAALAVRHLADEDRGAAALPAAWRERLTTPSWPFVGVWPMPGNADAGQWNGFLTGMFIGPRGLSAATWPTWQPMSGLERLHQPLHDRGPMWRWFERELSPYDSSAGDRPLLAVSAVDVMSGELCLFDSDVGAVTAHHLAASSAMPFLYDPVEIDGRLFWDGEVTRESALTPLLLRLLETRRVARDEPLRLVTVQTFPRRAAAPPRSGAEVAYRVLNLQQVGKLDVEPVDGIRIGQWLRIEREPLPEDGVSGQMDYSPERIGRLIEQGVEAARAALGRRAGEAASSGAESRPSEPRPAETAAAAAQAATESAARA